MSVSVKFVCRGCGNSFTARPDPSKIRENTIGSFNLAAAHGANLVEFDVLLSRDLVPIVYHDFEVLVPNYEGSLSKVLVSSLTLEQLQTGRCFHAKEERTGRRSFEQNSHPDFQPFPALEQVQYFSRPNFGRQKMKTDGRISLTRWPNRTAESTKYITTC